MRLAAGIGPVRFAASRALCQSATVIIAVISCAGIVGGVQTTAGGVKVWGSREEAVNCGGGRQKVVTKSG